MGTSSDLLKTTDTTAAARTTSHMKACADLGNALIDPHPLCRPKPTPRQLVTHRDYRLGAVLIGCIILSLCRKVDSLPTILTENAVGPFQSPEAWDAEKALWVVQSALATMLSPAPTAPCVNRVHQTIKPTSSFFTSSGFPLDESHVSDRCQCLRHCSLGPLDIGGGGQNQGANNHQGVDNLHSPLHRLFPLLKFLIKQ